MTVTDDPRALVSRLIHGIAPEADLTDVDPDGLLQEEVDLDSMDFLNLVTALHEESGIEVPERDYPELATINGFVAYIVAHRGASGAAGA